MIQAVQDAQITLTSNSASLPFADTDLRTNSANCFNGWLNHNEGSAQFNIVAGGIYDISFNANVTSATAGNVAIALKTATGTDVEGTEMDAEVTTAGNYVNISFTKLLRICPRVNTTIAVGSLPATITGTTTPVNTTTEIPVIKDANLIIEKIA